MVSVFIFAFGVFLFLIVVFTVWYSWKRIPKLNSSDQRYISKHWKRLTGDLDRNPSIAIINADKLLHYALRKRVEPRFNGLSFGDMLKKSDVYFSDINAVWRAHKLRNRIAHEIDVKLAKAEVKGALSSFKRALKDLGANL